MANVGNLLKISYQCAICILGCSSVEDFSTWEVNWINGISQDEEVFERNTPFQNDEPEINAIPEARLKSIHTNLEELKAYSLCKGYSDLFVTTQKTITSLEWIMSSDRGSIQTRITYFFI